MPADPPSQAPSRATGDRRQLTLLFCDIVGSTALSERTDPEDLREVIRRYQETAIEVVSRHGGTVARYIGDGLLVFFGYPQARDDDAVRAVRAGVELAPAVGAVSHPEIGGERIAARVGIHTGVVFVGEMAQGQLDVVGEAANVAARLQDLAEPGTVVMSATTRAIVAGFVDSEPLGERELKGLSRRVGVHRAVAVTDARTRLAATQLAHGLGPLLGRRSELAALQDAWSSTAAGAARWVCVTGPPGIGKSRLLATLCEHVGEGRWHEVHCSPDHETTPRWALRRLAERLLGLEADADEATRRAAVERTVERADVASTLELLGVSDTDATWLPVSVRRARLADALVKVVAAAAGGPVTLAVDDLQWCDPSSIDILRLARGPRPASTMVLLASRLDLRPTFVPDGRTTHVELRGLGPQESAQIVRSIAPAADDAALDAIIERSEGVPLFTEQLARMAVEAVDATSVPSTLMDLLTARLDRLGPAKTVAHVAAVAGRSIDRPTLSALVDHAGDLDVHLEALAGADLFAPIADGRYAFRHALIRDAAYETFPKAQRRDAHRRLAALLASADTDPAVLAHHHEAAGELETAIAFRGQAAIAAGINAGYVESRRHLERIVEMLEQTPPSPDRDRIEERTRFQLATSVMLSEGYAAPEVGTNLRRARELAEARGSNQMLAAVLYLHIPYLQATGDYRAAAVASSVALDISRRPSVRRFRAPAHSLAGATAVWRGRFAEGADALREAIALYADEPPLESFGGFARDPFRSSAYVLDGLVRWITREAEDAQASFDLAAEDAADDPPTLALVHGTAALVAQLDGDAIRTVELAVRARSIAAEADNLHWRDWSDVLAGWATARTGDATGIETMRAALASRDRLGVRQMRPYFVSLLASALLTVDGVDEASALVAQALEEADAMDEGIFLSELHRLRAEVAAAAGRMDEALAAAEHAVEVSRQQGAVRFADRARGQLDAIA